MLNFATLKDMSNLFSLYMYLEKRYYKQTSDKTWDYKAQMNILAQEFNISNTLTIMIIFQTSKILKDSITV